MKKVDGNQAKERKKQSRRKWLLLLGALLSIAMATVLALWGATVSGAHLEKGKLVRPQRVVHMVGANGEDIGKASAYVPYDQMPDSLWQAFVAVAPSLSRRLERLSTSAIPSQSKSRLRW